MHDLIVRVAKSAAAAVTSSAWPIRMAEHVMLRVDIAVTRQGDAVRRQLSSVMCRLLGDDLKITSVIASI